MTINRFISRIPQDTLAQASFNCKAYTRALMQFEQFIANTKQNLQEHLDFVQVTSLLVLIYLQMMCA